MKLIKYQKSRRLYSSGHGFVTYRSLLEHIKSGGIIQVSCGRSKTDITNEVLRKCLELKTNLYSDDLYWLLRK